MSGKRSKPGAMSDDTLIRRVDHLSVAVSRPDEAFAAPTGRHGLAGALGAGAFRLVSDNEWSFGMEVF